MKDFQHIVITGASSTIAKALCAHILKTTHATKLTLISRNKLELDNSRVTFLQSNYDTEAFIANTVSQIHAPIDGVILAHGVLHTKDCSPEKSLRAINEEQLILSFKANTMTPILFAKYLCPLIDKNRPSFIAALSARVGSISDNQLGGWYSYRASKAALNMLIKTLSIELAQSHPRSSVVALHPGTVQSALSEPFLSKIPAKQVMPPEVAAAKLWNVLQNLQLADSGKLLSYEGIEISF